MAVALSSRCGSDNDAIVSVGWRARHPMLARLFPRVSPIALLRFASQGLLRDESTERRSKSRTTLRRTVPSFTVEVRRRPKRATTSNPDAPSSEIQSPRAGFDRASHRVAATVFAAKKADPSPTEVASSPKGRVFPSLVPDEWLRRMLQDAAPTPTESDPPSRASKRPPIRTSKLPRNSRFSSAQNAPVAASVSTTGRQASGVPSKEGTGVPPMVAATVPNQVVGDAGGLALGARAKRRNTIVISRDDVRVKLSPNDQRSAIEADSPATLPSRVDDHSPRSRKRPVMARYVFGDELKPGERWKRRLLKRR
jgi:hypothetical protein